MRFLLIAGFFIAACHPEPPATEDLFTLQVSRDDGSTLDLSSLGENTASVFVFLAPDCPLSQNYTLALNELQTQFEADSIQFFGVVPGEWFDDDDVNSFADIYRIAFPLLRDRDFRLTRALGAVVTPEAFLIDSKGEVVYKGAIDNWASDLTQHRTVITAHYLRDALIHHLKTETPRLRQTQAIGCFIEISDASSSTGNRTYSR